MVVKKSRYKMLNTTGLYQASTPTTAVTRYTSEMVWNNKNGLLRCKIRKYCWKNRGQEMRDSPLGWGHIPRAGRGFQCCISPNVKGWRRTAPPTGEDKVPGHWLLTPHARRWSTRSLQRRCRPSCPVRGQTVLPGECWSLFCEPACHQPHLQIDYTVH